ncbi:DUF6098 family protein [Planosporangium sp. 12N6]|uniref:DUF6098 family protein n=1 Tax=Planosporangium spinosum TaxID=3402278 RepID=UPI003CF889EC
MTRSDRDLAMPTIEDLDGLAFLVESAAPGDDLYIRWSTGPDVDLDARGDGDRSSRDALTGVALPGLSANPLRVEPWWGDRSVRVWVARRLYDYRHLRDLRGPGVRPWVMVAEQCGRGPDNEPLVTRVRPMAWISDRALAECEALIEDLGSTEWGPLDRR